ncbi:hypothetical protein B1C78_03130 [Thioalkalivibrio denitrificans]|uniref:DUF1496 domain-containing protein n=1 Tax=Thioalkalivibrio denitrificans TaxID=108003 RepID=A0A1V3NRB6_9GAMM|nr:DUF1496 domain-containing protein [Thioalkalivibrio denitrificans]OOG27659.1 hypothetical protein B1C78_03130 [Thioalkalivibrio denitrificans]
MKESGSVPHVGAQDPELQNSPIAMEADEEMDVLRQEVPGEPVCYFNNVAFTHGDLVDSGGTLLRCDYGIWISASTTD